MYDELDECSTQVIEWSARIESIGEAVCAIGAFDGVHRGHRFLIQSMIDDARSRGCKSVIVTFDRDPDELFTDTCVVRKILSNRDRVEYLSHLGADYVLVVPFERELASLPYDEFLEGVLGAFMVTRCIHVGFDFKLGYRARGNVEAMIQWGSMHDCACVGYSLYKINGHPVTATRIRDLLAEGDVCAASSLLGRDYFVRGVVRHGRGAGKEFGIPTANVETCIADAPLKDGVYAGYLTFDGERHPAAINVGIPPTFAVEATCTLEPHVIDFDGDLYDKKVVVTFVTRLRDTMAFDSTEELVATVGANIEWVREHLS